MYKFLDFEVAVPTLHNYGISATVFLTVGDSGDSSRACADDPRARLPPMKNRPMLSWGEIREMQRAGMHFGAHTLTHPDLTGRPAPDIKREIVASKAILEQALGQPVTSFAYPFGRHDRRSHVLVRQHYDCACSDRLGLADPGSDLYALPRVDAYYLRCAWLADSIAKPWFPWYIRACSVPRRVRRRALALIR